MPLPSPRDRDGGGEEKASGGAVLDRSPTSPIAVGYRCRLVLSATLIAERLEPLLELLQELLPFLRIRASEAGPVRWAQETPCVPVHASPESPSVLTRAFRPVRPDPRTGVAQRLAQAGVLQYLCELLLEAGHRLFRLLGRDLPIGQSLVEPLLELGGQRPGDGLHRGALGHDDLGQGLPLAELPQQLPGIDAQRLGYAAGDLLESMEAITNAGAGSSLSPDAGFGQERSKSRRSL